MTRARSTAAPPALEPRRPADLRFPRRLRLRRRGDFQRTYRRGVRVRSGSFTLVACPNGLPHARLGLSVGKRCWKKATRRNRVRRVFREAFRLSRPDLPGGLDLVLVASTPALVPDLARIREELVKAARRAEERLRRRADGESGR